jgi:hypothetical protein
MYVDKLDLDYVELTMAQIQCSFSFDSPSMGDTPMGAKQNVEDDGSTQKARWINGCFDRLRSEKGEGSKPTMTERGTSCEETYHSDEMTS